MTPACRSIVVSTAYGLLACYIQIFRNSRAARVLVGFCLFEEKLPTKSGSKIS